MDDQSISYGQHVEWISTEEIVELIVAVMGILGGFSFLLLMPKWIPWVVNR